MSIYPQPREQLPIFNEYEFTYSTGTDFTQAIADTRYLKLVGGTITGNLEIQGALTTSIDFSDGTAALPSITFTNDLNTGIYRLGVDNIGISTGGSRAMNFSGSVNSSVQKIRCEYLGGNSQLCFENASLSDSNILFYSDSNDDFIIENNATFKKIFLQTSNAGQVVVQPALPTTTNINFCVLIGNGVSYDPLIEINESAIRSRRVHYFADGSLAAPSITFNSDPDTGLYKIGTNEMALVAGGINMISVDSLKISCNKELLIPDGSISKPALGFDTDPDTGLYKTVDGMAYTHSGSLKISFANTQTLFLTNITLFNGYYLKLDMDGTADAQGGEATLSGGTITISCSHIQPSDIVMLSYGNQASLTNPGYLFYDNIIQNTSFRINSSNSSDVNIVSYTIIKQN